MIIPPKARSPFPHRAAGWSQRDIGSVHGGFPVIRMAQLNASSLETIIH